MILHWCFSLWHRCQINCFIAHCPFRSVQKLRIFGNGEKIRNPEKFSLPINRVMVDKSKRETTSTITAYLKGFTQQGVKIWDISGIILQQYRTSAWAVVCACPTYFCLIHVQCWWWDNKNILGTISSSHLCCYAGSFYPALVMASIAWLISFLLNWLLLVNGL